MMNIATSTASAQRFLKDKSVVLTIGNFDGMHLGHRALVSKVVEETQKLKGLVQSSAVGGLLTFDPHPIQVLFPERGLKNIFDLQDRLEVARNLSLDFVVVQEFTGELSEMNPAEFFQKIVVEEINPKILIVGHDFNFGKNRSGTLEVLNSLCAQNNIELRVLPPVQVSGNVISSTAIRKALSQGDVGIARELLGRPFYIKGLVQKGAQRGRQIGFPTANVLPEKAFSLHKGVYVTETIIGKNKYRSATNVGENPTFETDHELRVESFLLDFNKDIYGELIQIEFLKFLRDEKKYNSVEDLKEQIEIDVKLAREFVL